MIMSPPIMGGGIVKKKRTSQGKKKIAIKKIEDLQSRHVTFSKRRPGLFKKCAELHSLCGADVAVFTFSIAGKPMSCGFPSAESVLQRYIHDSNNNNFKVDDEDNSCWWDKPIDNLGLVELEQFKHALEGFRNEVVSRVDELMSRDDQEAEIINDVGCSNSNIDDARLYGEFDDTITIAAAAVPAPQVVSDDYSDIFGELGCFDPKIEAQLSDDNNNLGAQVIDQPAASHEISTTSDNIGCIITPPISAAQQFDGNHHPETQPEKFDFGWIEEMLGTQITDYSSLMIDSSVTPGVFSESFAADGSHLNMLTCC